MRSRMESFSRGIFVMRKGRRRLAFVDAKSGMMCGTTCELQTCQTEKNRPPWGPRKGESVQMNLPKELSLPLVRVTEAAALKAARTQGHGDKNGTDKAATDAMRGMLDYIDIKGCVIIGEGEKTQAPMLYLRRDCRHAEQRQHGG